MQNIELFDEYVARTLGMLYGSFPIRIGLYALQMSGNPEVDDFGVPIDERGKRSKAFDAFVKCIIPKAFDAFVKCIIPIRKGSSIELAKEAAKAAIRAGMAIVK